MLPPEAQYLLEGFFEGMENPIEEIQNKNREFGSTFIKKVNAILEFSNVTCGFEMGTVVGILSVALNFAELSYQQQQLFAQQERREKLKAEAEKNTTTDSMVEATTK